MTPLTASAITARLQMVENSQVLSALKDLNEREIGVARSLLAEVSAEARIDPALFAADVRQRARDEAIREAERRPPGEAWRYGLGLMTDGQIAEFKRLVQDGSDPDEAAGRAMRNSGQYSAPMKAHAYDDAEPDEDLDEDDEPKPRRRRGVPRRRLYRLHRAEPKPEKIELPQFGPRLLRSGDDSDPYRRPFAPPWLLDDGEPDEEPDPDEGD